MTRTSIQFSAVCLILLSSVTAAQWNNVFLEPPTNVFSLSQFDNIIYAGGDSMLYYSTDGGTVWKTSSKVESLEFGISSIQKWNNTIFIGTYGRGVYETTNNGLNWIPRNNGLNNSGALEISSIAVRGDSLYASTIGEGVFVLNLLNPSSWESFRDGLPFGLSWNVYSLYNFDGTLICGAGGNAKVYFNEPGSASWIEKSFDLPAAEPNAMISITSYGDTLIGVSYFGIYKSQNNGDSWEYYDPGIGLISFASVIVVNDVLFALISKLPRSYLMSSVNTGVSWEFEFEFNTMAFSTLYYNEKLFTGRSDGLYRLPYTPTNIDDDIITNNFILYQNYPNPFNPSTKIKFNIPDLGTGLVRSVLKVYDIIGNEIATLIDEYKPAGGYEVEFNTQHTTNHKQLSSGVYFYQLTVGDPLKVSGQSFIETKKMLMIK